MLNQISIIGFGLMGASLALACEQSGVAKSIIIYDKSPVQDQDNYSFEFTTTIADCIKHADLIIIATPVLQTENIFCKLAPYLQADQVITDIGSTKTSVVHAAKKLGDFQSQLVPGHPIAGHHKRGYQYANANLFIGANIILTPTDKTDQDALATVTAFWQQLNGQPHLMSADEHDSLVAKISHAPHVIASAFINSVDDNSLGFAGPGFKDFTRIAVSNPPIWRDICLANRSAILENIIAFENQLDQFKSALATAKAEDLEKLFTNSKAQREKLL